MLDTPLTLDAASERLDVVFLAVFSGTKRRKCHYIFQALETVTGGSDSDQQSALFALDATFEHDLERARRSIRAKAY